MHNEDLHRWLHDYTRCHARSVDFNPNPWQNVLDVEEQAFVTGKLPKQLTWLLLVITPKPNGVVSGIGMLESVWKLIKKIID